MVRSLAATPLSTPSNCFIDRVVSRRPAPRTRTSAPLTVARACPESDRNEAPRNTRWAPVNRGARPAQIISAAADAVRVGALLTSHGDIDRLDELRKYTQEAVAKNPGLPVPDPLRPVVDLLGWPLVRKNLRAQYQQIGPTKYRENSEKQAAALTRALQTRGVPGRAYVGYNFTPPMIAETLEKMRKDGVTDIVVFNQGAQDSLATMGESIGEVGDALAEAPAYTADVRAVRRFDDDPRFVDLLAKRLREDSARAFPGAKPSEICLLLTTHGLPGHLIEKGDRAVDQMKQLVAALRTKLEPLGYQILHGFLNDDFFPGGNWTHPDSEEAALALIADVASGKKAAPKYVLIDGRGSFTVDHRATLFDGNIATRAILEKPQGAWPGAKVAFAPNFHGDPELAALYADLTVEALAGRAKHLDHFRPAPKTT